MSHMVFIQIFFQNPQHKQKWDFEIVATHWSTWITTPSWMTALFPFHILHILSVSILLYHQVLWSWPLHMPRVSDLFVLFVFLTPSPPFKPCSIVWPLASPSSGICVFSAEFEWSIGRILIGWSVKFSSSWLLSVFLAVRHQTSLYSSNCCLFPVSMRSFCRCVLFCLNRFSVLFLFSQPCIFYSFLYFILCNKSFYFKIRK